MLFQAVASGITAGSIYALVALAFVLVYKGTRVVNFGQGEQVMLGAYLALVLNTFVGLPFGAAVALALLLAGAFGLLIQVVVLRHIAQSPPLTKIIAMLAIGLILREGARALLGSNAYPFPFLLSPAPVRMGGVLLTPANLAIVVAALAVMAVFYVFFRYARLGKALRAACENPEAAALMGISVPFVFGSIWVLASALAAIAGVLLAPLVTLTPDMGLMAIKGWVAAVVGGFTSLPGAVVGGIVLGVIETVTGSYVSTALKDGVTYLLLILILIVRPSGLLERRTVKKV
ncbi:MAG: branched-chain amino acid ABC transporter permease [Candidatus Rokubacteria bacterium RIFCSPLOWO2_12_FULL_71_22]|nr:MAG: branched-chain amino acid ABC transporter permease [Candidatus Rokubacteria bacterium RIFCSPLOWO2_12_FULL_71_22]